MKALILEEFSADFQIKNIDKPIPAEGEVLVRIKASGINMLDTKIKAGNAAHAQVTLPAILGIDMAGIVESVGKNVTAFAPGDEVYGMTGGVGGVQGSLAEYAVVDSELLAIKPTALSFKEAAAIPLAFITAWEGLVDRAKIAAGMTVLIHGGTGSVGHIAIQLAKSFGAKIYATGSAENLDEIMAYGATAIDYNAISMEEYVNEYTDGKGFDVIFDTVGGTVLDNSFKAVKKYTGHVVSILGWGSHSLAPLSFRGATYSGVFTLMPLLTGEGRAHHGEIMNKATQLANQGKLKPAVNSEDFSFENITKTYTALEKHSLKNRAIVLI
ncbi:zinc-dependent alcohol dehydrogenase family protein [Flavobacterium sp. MC2016-06]|uniref:zinc-dependent alcohol dehydrogenase family protein n=1 Tax=Flavobacterium sp. MC2016-06 TaxID=2676308 RepID=UPI0012BAAF40|nr:zinc-dependent alcohol dehydrogenase family protein [Flavobacterium sp. MC2016-06]MBU3861710.1 zinc-dependent alcohol dehydrogenase family protein [Flavobacterium sp. MC2016-06]